MKKEQEKLLMIYKLQVEKGYKNNNLACNPKVVINREIDHVFNLIFNSQFNLNNRPLGFTLRMPL